MGSTDNEGKQPRSVLWHPSNFADFMKQQLGMINANQQYNNEFLMFAESMKFLNQVKEAISQNTVDLRSKPNLKLNETVLYKLDKIYNGSTFAVKITDEDGYKILEWKFFYEKPSGFPELNIQKLPALKSLNPTKTIDSKDWAISIREAVPIKYAFDGYDYETILTEGKFLNYVNGQTTPKFPSNALNTLQFKTHDVSRRYYNTTIDVLKKFWFQNWNILFVNLHRIIEHLEKGTFQIAEKQNKSFVSGE